jgi:light-regulated signal transduction histidine kinase (bacteriophytochrome)
MMSKKDRDLSAQYNELISLNYTISHEIKAPLRAIDGYARIFLEDYGDPLPEEAREMIETIRHICGDTISLSNMLLEYIRIAQVKPGNQVIDLEDLITGAFSSMRFGRRDGARVELTMLTEIPHIVGDEALIRQAVVNILSNSIKFTQDRDAPHIWVRHEFTDGRHIFSVRDNGVGFAMQYADKLFEMFQRMHSSEEFEGAGIGLAIIKMILSLHRGDVWIEGAVEEGATIFFSLPPARVLIE